MLGPSSRSDVLSVPSNGRLDVSIARCTIAVVDLSMILPQPSSPFSREKSGLEKDSEVTTSLHLRLFSSHAVTTGGCMKCTMGDKMRR
jgi:hypothetical protein